MVLFTAEDMFSPCGVTCRPNTHGNQAVEFFACGLLGVRMGNEAAAQKTPLHSEGAVRIRSVVADGTAYWSAHDAIAGVVNAEPV